MIKRKSLLLVIVLTFFGMIGSSVIAQENTRDVIMRAMRDELNRNMKHLAMENLKSPFFISYTIKDAQTLTVKSQLGSIVLSEEKPYRSQGVRVLVGDYSKNNENFMDLGGMGRGGGSFARGSEDLPLNDDYYGIRRALWIATDEDYKSAAEAFERKVSALKQQNISKEDSLDDLSKAPQVKLNIPGKRFEINKSKWENTALTLSKVFLKYPDIYSSEVDIYIYQADVYHMNSEGTETVTPGSIVAIQVSASTQADDGEPLSDKVTYYAVVPEELPALLDMDKSITAMATQLTALRKAPTVTDSYSGPVMFEDQAVGEIFAQRFFSSAEGLLASRKPIYSDPQVLMFMSQMQSSNLEDKMGKKVISNDITVKSTPKLKKYDNKQLIGSYEVDAEGVVPPDEFSLVDKGTLKNLLNGRTPAKKTRESNGHEILSSSPDGISSSIGPGVVSVSVANGSDYSTLKKQLLKKAKDEGLEFAYIIKRLNTGGGDKGFDPSSIMEMAMGSKQEGKISKPTYIYRVSVKDGKEELVRNAELGGLSINSLKKILGVSKEIQLYSTMLKVSGGDMGGFMFMLGSMFSGGWSLEGLPTSFIIPNSLVLEEFDIKNQSRLITTKPPVVENPVGR